MKFLIVTNKLPESGTSSLDLSGQPPTLQQRFPTNEIRETLIQYCIISICISILIIRHHNLQKLLLVDLAMPILVRQLNHFIHILLAQILSQL